MKSQLFAQEFLESKSAEKFSLQNERMLKVNLDGEIWARQGSMVAYQGNVDFEYKGAGMKRLLKKMATGEDLQLMRVSGSGDVFFGKYSEEVHLVQLENESLTVSGEHLLAAEAGLEWDVKRVKGVSGMLAGGLFNVEISGTGTVALTAMGTPVVLDAGQQPTYADMSAAIAWSTTLKTTLKKQDGMLKSMIGRGSGELFTMGFEGQGYVIVQPSEGYPFPMTGDSGGSAVGNLGSLFG
jgi:uncharacterized protein (AIM24 family)